MPTISIIIDSDVDPVKLTNFLVSLNDIYSELTDGDELVITYGSSRSHPIVATLGDGDPEIGR